MNNDAQERYKLIENFQTVSSREGFDRPDDMLTSELYNQSLDELVTRYGHDEQTHGYIMLSLDELQDRKPFQAVRGVALHLAHQACTLKMQAPAGSAQARGYEKLESRAAVVWRHLMQQDCDTPYRVRLQEYNTILHHSPSQALKAQLRFVQNKVHRVPGCNDF